MKCTKVVKAYKFLLNEDVSKYPEWLRKIDESGGVMHNDDSAVIVTLNNVAVVHDGDYLVFDEGIVKKYEVAEFVRMFKPVRSVNIDLSNNTLERIF